ncbi:MAG: hypothetical protein A2297_03880 [Elusimicrobia bacterium RIFOXYB2_FULL_48_7]|nr:MAG: hypothetical protein A2297_03880 [Elusimicrobia bacterium RIFOXYB2_FULL_48_7]
MHRGKILLIEDDPSTVFLITETLKREKYLVYTAVNLKIARGVLGSKIPGLIILDRGLPDGDGLDFCKEIRNYRKTRNIPVLFLTASSDVSDKITGLRAGGDDYLTKPFNIDELSARVEAMMRRTTVMQAPAVEILNYKGIELDITGHECRVDGRKVNLWPKEFGLLELFLERKGRVLSKDVLSENVWGREYQVTSRTIEMTVQRLRKKLGKKGKLIETVKAYGYKLTGS